MGRKKKEQHKRMLENQLIMFFLFLEWQRSLMGCGDDDAQVFPMSVYCHIFPRPCAAFVSRTKAFSVMKVTSSNISMKRMSR
jgi:hypothetical protein